MFRKPVVVLCLLLAFFVLLQCFLPLKTAIQVGSDEGFELAKAILCLNGHRLYSEVWNDQPPLHTYLVTQVLRHISPSILAPRLLTTAFTLGLVSALFLIVRRSSGLLVATLAILFLVGSPGFLELSASCMLEVPSLATAAAALCALLLIGPTRWRLAELIGGALFGVAMLMKLVPMIYMSLAALILWQASGVSSEPPGPRRGMLVSFAMSCAVLAVTAGLSFFALDLAIEHGEFLKHFQQSWASHFAAPASLEYGSAADFPFPWVVLARNWDVTLPAAFGAVLLLRHALHEPTARLPLAWLVLSFAVFATHRPWWPYYYIHMAIPLCWCAASGLATIFNVLARRDHSEIPVTARHGVPRSVFAAVLGIYALCALPWMGARLYLQVRELRHSPQTYSSLVLTEIQKFKESARWIYTDQLIYSFHAGIPMPCDLAVVPYKRFWCGEMTNARLASELRESKPQLILLKNDGRETPFHDLLVTEYRLVYQDGFNCLYAHQTIAKKRRF